MSIDKTASVLAFERRFDISDAIFMQLNSQENRSEKSTKAVQITEKSVRGTISNRLKKNTAENPVKLDAEIEKANLQLIDTASLDMDKDCLIVKWSCKVLPFAGKPCVCNNIEYQKELENTIQEYIKKHGVKVLAKRYAINILNGRWLWRNRMIAEQIELTIKEIDIKKDKDIIKIKDIKSYSLNNFDQSNNDIEKLTQLIEKGLLGNDFTLFEVEAKLIVGYGQEVYPSQELILNKGKSDKSKILYQKNNVAAMHSQKISNAVRTIDTWYADETQFPIAVEPYGSVTTMGHAFRQPKEKIDFYNLFDNWILKGKAPTIDNQHYVIAVLIRGGVFGASGKE